MKTFGWTMFLVGLLFGGLTCAVLIKYLLRLLTNRANDDDVMTWFSGLVMLFAAFIFVIIGHNMITGTICW